MTQRFTTLGLKARFMLQDVPEPQLYRDMFPFTEIPRIVFDGMDANPMPAKDIWITDTTFRDGQQARPPYTTEQIVAIFDFLHRLGSPRGVIRQSEFFLYSRRDAQAVEACLRAGAHHEHLSRGARGAGQALPPVALCL